MLPRRDRMLRELTRLYTKRHRLISHYKHPDCIKFGKGLDRHYVHPKDLTEYTVLSREIHCVEAKLKREAAMTAQPAELNPA